jgi:chromosome partitioning protein
MQRIVILNPKGGSGKTTVATNLAACFALTDGRPALMDIDKQASATRWLKKRSGDRPAIYGIVGFEKASSVTRSWQLRVPPECTTLVVDTPAAIDSHYFPEVIRGAHAVLVPVMPSEIDIHATARCIADLLLVAKVRRSEGRLGIIANRVRANTLVSQSLTRFLSAIDIPLVATLRDSQNYVRSAESGTGLLEMPRWQVWQDIAEWEKLLAWLASRRQDVVQRPSVVSAMATKATT